MSYSIIAAILLATIAVSSSISFTSNERNVLTRFYPNFGQIYRPATFKSYADEEKTTVLYQFLFTEKEYTQIAEESLTMLNTNIIERTITYHSTPNFEVVGSRYFYRRDPKLDNTVEIELVNSDDRLFREVRQPNRYFYLSSFDALEYPNQIPIMPYYEVSFICNSTFPKNPETQSPLLSYLDKSFQYSPRYLLDMPLFGTSNQSEMYAYADIRNYGEQPIVMKGAELIAGSISLNPSSLEIFRTSFSYPYAATPVSVYKSESSYARPLGELATGTYVYQLSLPTPVTLPANSIKSVRFFQTNVTVEPFAYYSSTFSPVNSNGKLSKAYNLTSSSNFLPSGRLLVSEQGRFVGQMTLPTLSIGETYTMVFGVDADISYRRQVRIVEGDENSDSIKYYVEYVFENSKVSRDVRAYFTESFSLFKYYQIKNISTSTDAEKIPDLVSYGTDLRGFIYLPQQNGQKTISFNLIIYKVKPTINLST